MLFSDQIYIMSVIEEGRLVCLSELPQPQVLSPCIKTHKKRKDGINKESVNCNEKNIRCNEKYNEC